jgi:thiol-disulfide isomerase/thioredoxin
MKKLVSVLVLILVSFTSMAQESITFQASIANRNGDIIFIKEGKKILQEIKIDSQGIFKATFPIKEGMYLMYDGVEYAQLYLKNGYNLNLTMDAKNFDESIKFQGNGSNENNYLAQEVLLDKNFSYDKVLASDEVTFKKSLEDKQKADLERLEKANLAPGFVVEHKKEMAMAILELQQYYTQISANKKMNNVKAPSFDYENQKGGKTSLESLKGKYVYIDVWATWCGPCRGEIPFLKTIEEKYKGKNIEFVSISVDVAKDHDKWKNFVTEKGLEGIQLFADKNWESSFIAAFGINSIPRFILIDPNGIVIDADAKRPSNPALVEQLNGLVK